jgi:hypothetical protein
LTIGPEYVIMFPNLAEPRDTGMKDWISVEDRLPDNPNEVLVFYQYNDSAAGQWVTEYVDSSWLTQLPITHWMPLPGPPK